MKTISFSEVRFVKAILEGKKTQTIRPAWKTEISKKILKKPMLKVGDSVKLYFRQRSSPAGSWFCLGCGRISEIATASKGRIRPEQECPETESIEKTFPKYFANARITEVFEIGMFKQITGQNTFKRNITTDADVSLYKIYEKDGFNSEQDMFNWFHKRYNLKEPKRFAVYRWEV